MINFYEVRDQASVKYLMSALLKLVVSQRLIRGVDGKLVGDVDIESVNDIASVCTPVPGGIGAVTTSILAMQVMKARIKR